MEARSFESLFVRYSYRAIVKMVAMSFDRTILGEWRVRSVVKVLYIVSYY